MFPAPTMRWNNDIYARMCRYLVSRHMKVQVKPKRTIVLHACHACSLPATQVQLRIDTLRRYGFVQCVNVQDNTTLVQINYLRTVWCIQAPKCVQRILETAIGPSWNRRPVDRGDPRTYYPGLPRQCGCPQWYCKAGHQVCQEGHGFCAARAGIKVKDHQ